MSARSNSCSTARRSLIPASSCSLSPSPRSSISSAKPCATTSPCTVTWVLGGENTAAFSTSSAIRWVTSATALPSSPVPGNGRTITRA